MGHIRIRLAVMNFLQFAVWGAYLTSMGTYLGRIGMGENIGLFYAMQGIVSLFMPALLGIIADRWIPAQKLLSISHIIAAAFMISAGYYGMVEGKDASFGCLFALYSVSVAFYMPTLALSNSVAYTSLEKVGLDTVKAFPPIRTLGTIGFICMMWTVDLLDLQDNYGQFFACGAVGILLGLYALTLPSCPVSKGGNSKSIVDALGLKAFLLFKQKRMAIFFIFSMLLGAALQITNGYANTFITSFQEIPAYADTWGARNANALISLSQLSETLCILLIPLFLGRFGIKKVMLIAMFAWVFRFGLFGLGNPGSGVWLFVLSCIVYGVAFDFFNISGSLYVNENVDKGMRSSAQGLFMLMTNGLGASIGTGAAGLVVNHFVYNAGTPDWSTAWYIFAAYAFVVGVLFMILFKDPKKHKASEVR